MYLVGMKENSLLGIKDVLNPHIKGINTKIDIKINPIHVKKSFRLMELNISYTFCI